MFGSTTTYVAEFWGLLEGLEMARRLGINNLEVHIDSNVIVSLFNKIGNGKPFGEGLVKKIGGLLR